VELNERVANATNSVGLFPGSFTGAYGFRNLLPKTGKHLKKLFAPTFLGSIAGAFLLLNTSNAVFAKVIPILVLLAATLLLLQPKIRALVGQGNKLPTWLALALQFLVSVYGGFFGAGMGIMMLACFALYIEGNVHELNAVKNWLSLLINFTCSIVFFIKGLVVLPVAFFLLIGAVLGGFVAARVSQRFDPNKLRVAIAVYGFAMAGVFAYQAYR
jgi:uncharacterized membrane protein YfcA